MSKKLLQNPYAYEGDIDYSEVIAKEKRVSERQREAIKLRGNPYGSLGDVIEKPEIINKNNKPVLPLNLRETRNPYASLDASKNTISKTKERGNPYALLSAGDDTKESTKSKIQYNKTPCPIERTVQRIHKDIWNKRNSIWVNGLPSDPVEMLEPSIGFEVADYEFDIYETLDSYSNGAKFKVAGLIDQEKKKVYISNVFTASEQRYTAAHELGHSHLHTGLGNAHRDRALNGGPIKEKRSKVEKEADDFAKYYLMPRNLVIRRFEKYFRTQGFTLNENTAFALDPGNKLDLLAKKITRRELSRIIAKATQYNGTHFPSLSEQFKVSPEAMAIRLEELELI